VKYVSDGYDNTLKALKERISIKFYVGVFIKNQLDALSMQDTLLYHIMSSPTCFGSDRAIISDTKYSFVFILTYDG
jgi:hypothetical protein